MKKLLSTFLIFVLLLSATSLCFASSPNKESISSNTVITENNIYDVLDYLGVDRSNFIKSDKPLTNTIMTVGELSKVIENAKNRSHSFKIIDTNTNNTAVDATNTLTTTATTYPVKTKYYFMDGAFCEIGITGKGSYSGTTWKSALGGTVYINDNDFAYTSTISSVDYVNSYLSGGLVTEAEFNVKSYFIAQYGLLEVGDNDYYVLHRWPTP